MTNSERLRHFLDLVGDAQRGLIPDLKALAQEIPQILEADNWEDIFPVITGALAKLGSLFQLHQGLILHFFEAGVDLGIELLFSPDPAGIIGQVPHAKVQEWITLAVVAIARFLPALVQPGWRSGLGALVQTFSDRSKKTLQTIDQLLNEFFGISRQLEPAKKKRMLPWGWDVLRQFNNFLILAHNQDPERTYEVIQLCLGRLSENWTFAADISESIGRPPQNLIDTLAEVARDPTKSFSEVPANLPAGVVDPPTLVSRFKGVSTTLEGPLKHVLWCLEQLSAVVYQHPPPKETVKMRLETLGWYVKKLNLKSLKPLLDLRNHCEHLNYAIEEDPRPRVVYPRDHPRASLEFPDLMQIQGTVDMLVQIVFVNCQRVVWNDLGRENLYTAILQSRESLLHDVNKLLEVLGSFLAEVDETRLREFFVTALTAGLQGSYLKTLEYMETHFPTATDTQGGEE